MYTQPIDRMHPGCIVLLVDQSGSMADPIAGLPSSKATVLAQTVNRLLRNLVLQCQRGEDIRDYYSVGIMGYGATVGSAFLGKLAGQHLVPISYVADFPALMTKDSLPGNPELSVDLPVWIEPVADGGTPMSKAIDMTGAMVVEWANDNPDSFPPIVINITDGEATDEDPRRLAAQLRGIHTRDGDLLMFNIHLSDTQAPVVEYPSSPIGLPDKFALTLFEMSSELTPYMVAVARGLGLQVTDGARGFAFNADAAKLSEFLDVGTRISQVPDR